MSFRAIIALALVGCINSSVIWAADNSSRLADIGRPPQRAEATPVRNATAEPLETAPTITSVHHQVWTSSSSGRMDELSPEIISKLRNDVPFLAAYALRPRLVGGPASTSAADIVRQQSALAVSEKLVSAPHAGSDGKSSLAVDSLAAPDKSPLEVGASAPKAARQSLVPRLGDFSEFDVETSSLSKSEHHHRRKTSLKRPKTGKVGAESRHLVSSRLGRKRAAAQEDSLSQLVKRVKKDKQRQVSGKRARSSAKKRSRPARRSKSKRRRSSRRRNSSRRSRSNKKRRARLLQDQDDGQAASSDGVKGGASSEGEVKGGGSVTKKPPFFAGGQKPKPAEGDARDRKEADRSLEGGDANSLDGPTDDANDGEAEIDDEPQAEPKRVGDDDVEEDGDTVMVEPKFDGVEDDPPLPDSPDELDEPADGGQERAGGADNDVEPRDKEETTTPSPAVSEGDPRGNRVNRQKPNVSSDSEEGADEGTGGGQVAGGGLGATVGNGGSGGDRGEAGAADSDRDNGDEGDESARPRAGRPKETESGVEFADEDKDEAPDRKGTPTSRPDDGFDDEKKLSGDGGASDGNFGERRPTEAGSRESGSEGASRPAGDGDSVDDDLDYRDEMEKSGDKTTTPTAAGDAGSGRAPSDGSRGSGENATRVHSEHGNHCDDGSYDHHGDHHHHHHDTIDWLRGAIPGEPGEDYPTLSRVNVTDFSCADQEHPGYYADVGSRCQIFHICQADGRQDSFLCPNGTIFSQKSLVCVWWNGFHCEDAPKFYHLNELLYKTTDGSKSPQAAALPNLRPLDGAHLRPRAMKANADADDTTEDDSPIDGATPAAKRGRPSQESAFMGGRAGDELPKSQTDARNNIAPDDDATIQRKSTNLDDDSIDEPPARLRARDHIPRRRRRASTRQAPPKLKSRRVSRNSRRRKLRHGIKPRRRA